MGHMTQAEITANKGVALLNSLGEKNRKNALDKNAIYELYILQGDDVSGKYKYDGKYTEVALHRVMDDLDSNGAYFYANHIGYRQPQ